MPKVVIMGGGVAGMSAAHELLDRGFDVEVYEFRPVAGGKARSIPSPNTGTEGRKDLPGEHGFRFFPGFYKHIINTMQRIPVNDPAGNYKCVADHLVIAQVLMMTRYVGQPLTVTARFPESLADIERNLHMMFDNKLDISDDDYAFFAERIWQLMTTCWDRRREEYDKISWWQYIDAANPARSDDYRKYFAIGLTRTLVAAKADEVSIKTGGDILVQLMLNMATPGFYSDRLLDGPTSEVWIQPWLEYLTTPQPNRPNTATFFFEHKLKEFVCDSSRVTSVIATKSDGTDPRHIKGDYFIAAVPIEVMVEHLQDTRATKVMDPADRIILDLDPSLTSILSLNKHVRWMNGIQFFLKKDVPVNPGHVTYIDTPWALTSISQKQFWKNIDLSHYGNGEVEGILSVDVSDWTTPGCVPPDDYLAPQHLPGKPFPGPFPQQDETWVMKAAQYCNEFQVMAGVWTQLKKSLNHPQTLITDDLIYDWYLCPDKIYWRQPETTPPIDDAGSAAPGTTAPVHKVHNWPPCSDDPAPVSKSLTHDSQKPKVFEDAELGEPLLVNAVRTWAHRPDAFTNIPNFFLASDYVRTFTDLATMEGANEAARRAVNAILSISGTKAPYCQLWNLHEPDILHPFRLYDSHRYSKGLPWHNELPHPLWLLKIISWIARAFESLSRLFAGKNQTH